MIAYWFDEFNVAPGEVVNIGTLRIDYINVRALPGMSDRVLNALFTRSPSQLNTYCLRSTSPTGTRAARNKYPQPRSRPCNVHRQRSWIVRVRRIIVESYAPGADGTMPSVRKRKRL
jgi:hypothetical protein